MLKMIDLTYYANDDIGSLAEMRARHITSLGYIAHICDRVEVEVVKHLAKEEEGIIEGIKYRSFRSNNKLLHIPAATHAYIKAARPDIVLVQGLGHPLQVQALRKKLGKRTLVLVQHHGETPHGRLKMLLQNWVDRYIDAYLFTATGNAQPWIEKGIIRSPDKCREVIEASTYLQMLDKSESLQKLGINGSPVFLSVADLNANKDPFTILRAFEQYLVVQPAAKLYMIYRDDKLLYPVKRFIREAMLDDSVILIGQVPHQELAYWFSAADYYISGSHKEGSGYALIEAMACGCIPIVTNIAPYRKLTSEGNFALLWEKGNTDSLLARLKELDRINMQRFSANVHTYSLQAHSFKAIADDMYAAIEELVKSKRAL